jgi:hypothetical protein
VDHVESTEFAQYLDLFKEGLTDEQVELVRELFGSLARWRLRISDLLAASLVVKWDQNLLLFETCVA